MSSPAMPSLDEALAAGPVVLDGGLSTELEARGHDVSSALWSARLLRDDPGAIVAAHAAFAAAGAQVATTASYQATVEGFGIAYICQIYCSDSNLIKSGVNNPALDPQLRAVNQLPTPDQQYAKAVKTRIVLHQKQPQSGCIAAIQGLGFFCEYVRQLIANNPDEFGKLGSTRQARLDALDRGGLTIRSTIDLDVQRAAQKARDLHL